MPPKTKTKPTIPPLIISMDELAAILNDPKAFIDGGFREGPIKTDFEISPSDFLKYAEDDLASSSAHKYINALSNAKRSLDCQLDTLLIGFGFYGIAKKGYWGFPKKIELLKTLGLLAPRVLSKINRTRNLMEHEFKSPDPEKVEDFIDIVSLFLAATVKYTLLLKYYKEIWIANSAQAENKYVDLAGDLDYSNSKLIFTFTRWVSPNPSPYAKQEILLKKPQKFVMKIEANDAEYKGLLRSFLRIDFER